MLTEERRAFLTQRARQARALTLEAIYRVGRGHIGGTMSIAELLIALYDDVMRVDPSNPSWPERDRLVVSKGHAAPIVYAVLAMKGYFDPKLLDTLNANGTTLPSHCDMRKVPGIDMTAGSLGNGIAIGAGMALAGKYQKKDYTVYVIAGDGELQEGVVWEGVNVAAGRRLDNLIVFVDRNGWQSGGTVEETVGRNNVAERFAAFGWHVQEISGHDIDAVRSAVAAAKAESGRPHVIVCDCVKGKGVSYMENDNAWHKGVPTDEQYATAKRELEGA